MDSATPIAAIYFSSKRVQNFPKMVTVLFHSDGYDTIATYMNAICLVTFKPVL